MLRFHTQTSGVSLTAQQPENNIIRVAYQALAAVLGGAQSLAACSFDEALAIPTEKSVRLSLRTQQILAHEAGVTDTVDPMGGSHYVESLTRTMESEIKELIAKIDDMGGAIAAIETGFIQKEIEGRAYAIQKEIEKKERIVVGLNEYKVEESVDASLFKFDVEQARRQISNLQALRESRDQAKCQAALEEVRKAAEGRENLMPRFIEAVKAYATLGEICGVLREVFGEYQQHQTLG
jgi:methylmalonyl-CoA mutase N-terminal domain/subunit